MQVKFCNINPKSSEILVFTKELPQTLTQSCPSTDQQMCQVDRKTSPFLWNLSVMTLYILYNHVYTSPMYIIYICTSVLYMSLCTYLFAGHLIQTWRAACRPWSQRCPSPLSAGWSSWHNFQTSEDSFVLKLQMTAGIHSNAEFYFALLPSSLLKMFDYTSFTNSSFSFFEMISAWDFATNLVQIWKMGVILYLTKNIQRRQG